jgi:hypothetical protein
MNRITVTKEALQTLSAARQSLEKAIREAKVITRQPHTTGSGASLAQSQLHLMKREATLLYTALAACRGKLHCKNSEERLDALRKRASSEYMSKYLSETEKLVLELFAPSPGPALNSSVAA